MSYFISPSCEYVIDHHGIDGRWRVWWIDSSGTREQLFRSEAEAKKWAEEMCKLDIQSSMVYL